MKELLTIGYEGTIAGDMIATLRHARVELLIDVRAIASSRKPGFFKTLLAAGLAEHGIGYVHLHGLGTPKEGRQAVRSGHPEQMREIFAEHMRSDRAQVELTQAIALAQTTCCCLLCFEQDHTTCHRSILATAIQVKTLQEITHLEVASKARRSLRGHST